MENAENPTKTNKLITSVLIFVAVGFIINGILGYFDKKQETPAVIENSSDIKGLQDSIKALSNRVDALEAKTEQPKTVANANK